MKNMDDIEKETDFTISENDVEAKVEYKRSSLQDLRKKFFECVNSHGKNHKKRRIFIII